MNKRLMFSAALVMALLSRTEMMLGEDALTKLKKSKVAVFGCGGVGSYTLDSLVRAGVRKYCYNR